MKPKARPFVQKTLTGNLIRLADFYECCENPNDVVEVSDEVLESLMAAAREERRYQMECCRHHTSVPFDETFMGELEGLAVTPTDDLFFEKLESEALAAVFRMIDPVLSKRFYLYYGLELRLSEIAEMEGVSHVTVWKSIQKAKKELKDILCDSDNENPDTV